MKIFSILFYRGNANQNCYDFLPHPVRMTVFEKSEELPVLVRMEGECFMTFPGETGTNTYSPKIGH